jgi:hypothetical protein
MNRRSQIILRAAILSLAGLALAGCETIRNAAGDEKSPPDEFAVVTKAPLVIPPDYNLRPPQPGAAPTNQTSPTQSAEAALFPADPQTVAQGMKGNYSMGEKLLLANANAENANPGIREQLRADEKSMQGSDESFTDRILYGKPVDNGHPIDADAQANNTGAAVKPAKQGDSATISKQKSDGGWFDWF